ncbi:hypothetical protein JZM24_15000 [Candidatus Sodalis endolongispinus]|uniref:Uncharacterized protein n=1 Tax=Candidatus Sodalis endolongispinus TaxID=2812662 RepID=A0ABS5YDI6_9GAMM|nr:hypothetical protein [Candidatus Sodalis endolongispinus]MBT9433100.1 hypothetical protein [Candidatus Sodalis endolongispinus]
MQAERGTNNVYGHLQGSRDVTLKSNKLDNQGGRLLALGGDAQLETQLVIVNTGGQIEVKNRLSTRSQHLMNAYGVMASDEVTVNTRRKSLSNTGGSVSAKRGLRITSGPLENNGGRLQSGGNLVIDTRNSALCNRFTVNAVINCGADLFLDTGDIDNTSGMITAAGRTEIVGGAVKNVKGMLATARGMKLLSRSLDNEGGNVQAGALLVVNTGALDNTAGRIRAAGVARINSREFDNCGGCLQTGRDLHIDTQGQRLINAYNSFAGILAGGNLTLHAGQIDNTAGLINASGVSCVTSDALLNTRGRLQSGEYLQLDTHGQRLSNINSVNTGILSGGDLWLHAGEIDNTSGIIVAVGETRVSRTVLNNLDGRLFTDPALVLLSPTLTLPGVMLDDGAPTPCRVKSHPL